MVDLQDNGDGWSDPRDVKLDVNYPIQGGAGACITFVELTVFHVSLLIFRLILFCSSFVSKMHFGIIFCRIHTEVFRPNLRVEMFISGISESIFVSQAPLITAIVR